MHLGPAGNIAAIPLFSAVCSAAESVGDGVYISGPLSGGLPTVSKVDITDPAKMPAVGIIESKSSSTECVVQTGDIIENLPFTLTTGKRVFFVNAGLDSSIPGVAGDFAQIAGTALDTDAILVAIGAPIRRS